MKIKHHYPQILSAMAAAWGFHGSASALVIKDTLNGASSSFNWATFNGACLTAGDGTGTIPACVGLPYYAGKTQVGGTTGRLPDAVGSGALRLTNGDTKAGSNGNNQTGAVVSNFTFPTNDGVQVTFKTVSYGGNNFNGTGADGITFFLSNGTLPPTVGAFGGSLGYSCSNNKTPADGVDHGYLAVGIDEYGNFANPDDNTHTGPGGLPGSNFRANRISIRGSGETTWTNLNLARPNLYPSTLDASQRAAAVRETCRTGMLMNYGPAFTDSRGRTISNGASTRQSLATAGNLNYPLLANSDLSINLANQQAVNMPVRGNAIPINYAIKITQAGLLDFSYSVNGGAVQQVFNQFNITAGNGALPPSFRFGFSGGTGGGSNVHEILCFKAAPATDAGSSAGSNVQQAAVRFGTQVYLASYHPLNWWGQLTAQDFLINATTGDLSISPVANWDAHCTLTGGNCDAITPTTSATKMTVTAQAPSSRQILTWDGTQGTSLAWGSLSTTQQSALSAGGTNTVGSDRLDYLRGTRTNEIASGGVFRTRTSVLGDIVDSSPTWVGPPTQSYRTWTDKLYPTQTAPEAGVSYNSFKTANATRQNLVYVGANDGLLHAFRAGSSDASGNFVGTTNTGTEALAYMPAAVVSSIHSTTDREDFSSPQYGHNFYVNATPGTGDLFYNGAWHTWLVSGLGAGGNITGAINNNTSTAQGALFALDITDPTQFNQTNARNLVQGEWSSNDITCTNVTNCAQNLGSIYGTPVIRRLHNGQWAVLFGNGLNSSAGVAGMFIMLVDSGGNKSFRFLSTNSGPVSGNKNGIAYVTPADLDDDHITDYVYAGDVSGNLWRFDLTSDNPNTWAVSSPALFKTANGQPITNKVVVAAAPVSAGSLPRVVIGIGTGQRFVQTALSAETYATSGQSLYGVWDSNLTNWNSSSAAKYAALTGTPTTATPANLLTQTVTSTTAGAATGSTTAPSQRTISANQVCWQGSIRCTGGAAANTHLGWKMALPVANEQAFYNPVLEAGSGNLVVNTTIPPSAASTLSCDAPPPSGYSMAVSMTDGGASTKSFFTTSTGTVINGLGISGTGSPSFVKTPNGRVWMINQVDGGTGSGGSAGAGSVVEINKSAGVGKRLNWIKLR